MIEILKKYTGVSIIEGIQSHEFRNLLIQIKHYREKLLGKINDEETIIIYSDYNFYSISLLIALYSKKINVVPIIKTTKKELADKIDVCFPDKLITINKSGELDIEIFHKKKENKLDDVYSKGDTGIILFSSGTTGKPKVMVQNLTKLINSIPKPKKQKSLVFILFLMFDHIGGLNTLFYCLICGSTFVIPKNRKPSTIIKTIFKNKINILPTSPTFLNLMLMDESFDPKKLQSLKLITYGTERMPIQLLKRLNELLPKIKFLQTFGTSETGILKTISKSSDSLYFKISDPEKDYKIVDGELYLKSKNTIKGYINQANTNFKSDGWFATGDLVQQDEEGYIRIIGRNNNVINVGGLKVLPSEIEEVINSVEGVVDCTVYEEPNNIVGSIVCAKVYVNNLNNEEIDYKKKIKSYCRKRLDKYKIPVKIYITDDLKINQRGKKLI